MLPSNARAVEHVDDDAAVEQRCVKGRVGIIKNQVHILRRHLLSIIRYVESHIQSCSLNSFSSGSHRWTGGGH